MGWDYRPERSCQITFGSGSHWTWVDVRGAEVQMNKSSQSRQTFMMD